MDQVATESDELRDTIAKICSGVKHVLAYSVTLVMLVNFWV